MFEGKRGKGNGKHKSGNGQGKGERVVTISNANDPRQQRASDMCAAIKEKMLSTILPKIAGLSIDGSDTLFEVLLQGAKLSEADVKKYLGEPDADQMRLVLSHYETRWENDPEFREILPEDRGEFMIALKEWINRQFTKRSSTLADSPRESRLSGDRLSTRSSPAHAVGGNGGKINDLGQAHEAAHSPTRYNGTRSSTSKLSLEKSGEKNATPRTAPDSAPGSAARRCSQTRSPDEVSKAERSDTHRQPSCVTLPPPQKSPAPSNSMMLLPQPPLQSDRIIGGDGDLSVAG